MADRTVTTEGVGRVRAEPEHSKITARIHEEADSPTEARQRSLDRYAAVVDSLVTAGIDERAIRRASTQLNRTTDTFHDTGDYEFEATESIVVRCPLETTGDAVETAIAAGATIDFVEHGFTDERKEHLKQRALTEAMEVSRRRAETIAQASGEEVGELLTVTTDAEPTDGMKSIVDEALSYSSRTDIHPGELTVPVRVEACYRLESPESV